MVPAFLNSPALTVASLLLLPAPLRAAVLDDADLRHASRALPSATDVAGAQVGLRTEFGARVAISQPDLPSPSGGPARLAVAAPSAIVDGAQRGRVDLFQLSLPDSPSGAPRPVSRTSLTARSLSEGARFGAALSWSGNWLAVGAPNANSRGGARAGLVRVFRVGSSPGGPIPVRLDVELEPEGGAEGGAFGSSIAWSSDGKSLAVGAPFTRGVDGTPFAGAVHVFHRDGEGWTRSRVLSMSEPAVAATFGHALIWAGEVLVVGAPGEGSLAPGAGRIFGFFAEGTSGEPAWSLGPAHGHGGATGAAGSRFGEALASDGSTSLVVGIPGRGAVEVLEVTGSGRPPRHRAVLQGDAVSAFGRSVAMGPSGMRLLVGAPSAAGVGPNSKPAAGAVYAFERTRGGWRSCGSLGSVWPAAFGEFGLAVSLVTLEHGRSVAVAGEPGADLTAGGGRGGGAGAASVLSW
ncbi:MAG: hypothetical protein AAGG01_08645 [Planctomycetota bacterium]